MTVIGNSLYHQLGSVEKPLFAVGRLRSTLKTLMPVFIVEMSRHWLIILQALVAIGIRR